MRGRCRPGADTAARRLLSNLAELVEAIPDETAYFDAVIGGLSRNTYDQLVGEHETLTRHDDGQLVWAKDIHLLCGTITLECPYAPTARRAA